MTRRIYLFGMIVDAFCMALNILVPLLQPRLHWFNLIQLFALVWCTCEFLRNLRLYRKG